MITETKTTNTSFLSNNKKLNNQQQIHKCENFYTNYDHGRGEDNDANNSQNVYSNNNSNHDGGRRNNDQINYLINHQHDLFYNKRNFLTKLNRNSASVLSAPVPLISGAGAAAAGITTTSYSESKLLASSNLEVADNEAIKCIFLCEFHVTAGRKITVQVPENYLSKEKFETVSRYVIPQIELQRSFLCLSLLGIKILGYPVRIDNKQYARNAFYFNVCFVFAPTTRTIGYEPVVKKLSEYLLSMEKSSRLLSQQSYAVELGRLARILTHVRNDINSKKMSMLQEGSTLIPMCVVPRYLETVEVRPHHAVALTDDFYKYVRNQWDLTTLRILPYIDGFNHVNRITALADVALELVCECIRHLVVLGVAVLVPVFQYGNIYRPTPKLSQLAKDRQMQQRCVQRCSKSERQKAKIRDIFRFFASMAHGATFGELCVRFNPQALHINEKEMVLFGQLEGLIRRVEKYPVTIQRDLFAEDVDNITKRKMGLVSGQIPNTPVFEQQHSSQSFSSNDVFIPCGTSPPASSAELNNNYKSDDTPEVISEDNNDANNYTRLYKRLPSKPIPRSGRAAYKNTSTSFLCNNSNCCDPQHTVMRQQNTQKDDLNPNDKDEVKLTTYNGLKSFDEICCETGMSCQQLDFHLARDKHVIVLLK